MDAEKPNAVLEKSYSFALRIVQLSRHLQADLREYVLSRQVQRSGTSIGANVEEANAGLTKRDFTAKMGVASKEARETRYWLRLLRDSNTGDRAMLDPLLADCGELVRMLTAIVKTSQETI